MVRSSRRDKTAEATTVVKPILSSKPNLFRWCPRVMSISRGAVCKPVKMHPEVVPARTLAPTKVQKRIIKNVTRRIVRERLQEEKIKSI